MSYGLSVNLCVPTHLCRLRVEVIDQQPSLWAQFGRRSAVRAPGFAHAEKPGAEPGPMLRLGHFCCRPWERKKVKIHGVERLKKKKEGVNSGRETK